MAITKELHVGIGRTIGLPNYGSIRFDLSETVEVAFGEDREAVQKEVYARVATRLGDLIAGVTQK